MRPQRLAELAEALEATPKRGSILWRALGRGAGGNTLQAVRMELGRAFGDSVSVQLFSGESKQGVDELRAIVAGWLEL